MLLEISIGVILLVVIWEISLIILEPKNLPPGLRVPSVIAIAFFPTKEAPHKRLQKARLVEKYGDVACLKMGRQLMVVVSSMKSAREALIQKHNDFAGRPRLQVGLLMTRNGKDIAFGEYGPGWRIHRKIVLSALKTYGSGLSVLEDNISQEVHILAGTLKENLNTPFDLKYNIINAVLNVICAILFGERYNLNDPEFFEIERFHSALVSIFARGQILEFIPFLKYFPVQIMHDIKEATEFRDRFFERKLAEHRATFQEDKVRDLTDALLKSSKEAEGDSTVKQYLSDDYLIGTMMDAFIGGAETTASTIRWVLLYLIRNPDVQERIHREIDDVIGRRLPKLSDRGSLPYFEATIKETIRHATPFVVGAPHKTTSDTTLKGFNIPKDTLVIFNLWEIHHDPCQWKNPHIFDPTRFLDEQGKLRSGSTLSYMPFSLGPRACLGESLAKTELFLFLSRLLQEFKFENPIDVPFPDLEGTFGVVKSAKPFDLVITKRV